MDDDFTKKTEETRIQLYLFVLIGVAALMHVFLAVYFFIVGLYIVGLVNVGDVLIWCVAFFVNKSGRIKAASFIAMLKVITYSLVGSYMLGLNVNVQWIILAVMPPILLYLNFTKKEKIFLILLVFFVINLQVFIGVNFEPPFAQEDNTFLKVAFTNIIITAIVIELVLSALISSRLAASHKKQVEDYKQISYTDPLTKLSNRRHADIFFKQLQHDEENEIHCLAIIDIDDFKLINDKYGHDIGDIALIKLSDILREGTRSRDLICRWGGEEFLLVLYGCSLKNGLIVLEKLRKTVEQVTIPAESGNIRYTVTIGVTMLDKDRIDESIRICDRNLYEGKRSGKNKIVG